MKLTNFWTLYNFELEWILNLSEFWTWQNFKICFCLKLNKCFKLDRIMSLIAFWTCFDLKCHANLYLIEFQAWPTCLTFLLIAIHLIPNQKSRIHNRKFNMHFFFSSLKCSQKRQPYIMGAFAQRYRIAIKKHCTFRAF